MAEKEAQLQAKNQDSNTEELAPGTQNSARPILQDHSEQGYAKSDSLQEQKFEIEPSESKSGKKKRILRIAFGALLLFLSVIGGALIGPSSELLESESHWVKMQYAQLLRAIYCVPLIIAEALCSTTSYRQTIKKAMTWKNIILLIVTPALQTVFFFGLIFGAANLIQSHAYVCNTMFCIFIVLIGYCRCLKPYKWEIVGLVITVGGVACMFADPDAVRTDGKQGEFYVYAVCIFCAFVASFWMLCNDELIHAMPLFFNLFVQTLIGEVFIVIIIYCISHDEFKFFSLDKNWGAFGMFHSDEVVTAFFVYGPSAGFFGVAGYVCALKFFSPVVVSAAFLFEPAISQLIGWLLEIDQFPGWMTWLGTICVFIGISFIQKGDRQRNMDKKKTEGLAKVQAESELQRAHADREAQPNLIE